MASMRGDDRQPDSMFSYVSAEQRVPQDHPLRVIRALVDAVLREMSREFDGLYATVGRPSVPRSACCARSCSRSFIRFERAPADEHWITTCCFVGSSAWRWTSRSGARPFFTKNRDRLLNQRPHGVFRRVVERARDLNVR